VWGAAGDFVTPDNLHVGFTQPEPFRAMQRFFGLLRYMKPLTTPFEEQPALQAFLDGQAAVTMVGAGIAYEVVNNPNLPAILRENIGFAPMPGVPWVGGDNLVIWKHISVEPEREKAAVALVQHLLSHESQTAHAHSEDFNIPARLDAFDALPMRDSQLTRSIVRSLRTGRAYRSLTSWSKIEHRFGLTFGKIGAEILNGADVDESTRNHLKHFAQWLEIVLQ
jgi:ABC-type glycerol-3-phosphate transport system substrate-binding protein